MGGKNNNGPSDNDVARATGPFLPSQGPIAAAIKRLQDQYLGAGNTPQYGPGIVQPLNSAQLGGINQGLDLARGGIPGFQGGLQDFAAQYANNPNAPGADFYRSLASGSTQNPTLGRFQSVANQAQTGSAAARGIDTLEDFARGQGAGKTYGQENFARGGGAGGTFGLEDFASGKNLSLDTNPYLKNLLDIGTKDIRRNFQETVNPTIEGIIGRAGTGGGGSAETLLKGQAYNELSGNLGDFTNQFLGQTYDQDRNRQLQAQGQLGQFSQADRERQLQAQNSLSQFSQANQDRTLQAGSALPGAEATRVSTALNGLGAFSNQYQTNLQNRLTGTQGSRDLYQQNFGNQSAALGQLPGLFQGGLAPSQAQTQLGGILQNQSERTAAEAQDRFRFNDTASKTNFNQYLQQLLSIGAAGQPGAGAAQLFQQQPSGLQQGIGNATGILGLAGGVASLFSDRRLKVIHRKIGQTEKGIPIYTFNYIPNNALGLDSNEIHVGVIAQEVREICPEAVFESRGGFLIVDYARID